MARAEKGFFLRHEELYFCCVGTQFAKYRKKWGEHPEDMALGFSLPGLLLGPVWLLYRKLWREAAVFIALLLAMSFAPDLAYTVVLVLLQLLVGLFGSALYYHHCERMVRRALALPQKEREGHLLQKGGFNLVAPAVFIALDLVAVFLAMLLQ